MRQLPPLRALKAFEAVARLASVTAAARELNVSHGAVSQQIKLLEGYFGQRLFRKCGRGIELTEGAAVFLEDVRAALDRIALAAEQFTRRSQWRPLKINTTPSFAMRWLIPHSSSFQLDHPGIEIKITTSVTDGIEHLQEPIDFIIRREPMARADHVCQRFLDDVSTAVVSPAVLETHELREPEDLLALPLLHIKSRPDAWKRWFKACGVTESLVIGGPFYDHFFLSLQAAITGLGAAMAPFAFIADDLAGKRLVAPFPERVVAGPGFHVLFRPAIAKERHGRALLDWLLAQGQRQD
jgi:LysR family glycine cleavage system transcriptional activator